jgi:histidinol-phosphate/aromatic aminotransferase/cobyric acid decarboxylase-like protein
VADVTKPGSITDLQKFEHGGNVHRIGAEIDAAVVDFSANINPLGPPAWLRSLINHDLHLIAHYPDPTCEELAAGIAERYKADRRMVVPANGTTELLYLLPTIIKRRKIVIPVPCYVDYIKVFELHGFAIELLSAESREDPSLTFERLEQSLGGGCESCRLNDRGFPDYRSGQPFSGQPLYCRRSIP